MTSHPCHFDIARYSLSYSQPKSTLHVSVTAQASRRAIVSSFLGSKVHHIQDISSENPVSGGLRNEFGRYPMASNVQPLQFDANRPLNYPNNLLSNEEDWSMPPIWLTRSVAQSPFSAQDVICNTPTVAITVNDERRRRSSALSPRSIMTPFSNSFLLPSSGLPTPPSSSNFANHAPQAQQGGEPHAQGLHNLSMSTTSSITKASTASTEDSANQHDYSRRSVFALLSEICTEALRRKWHDNTQREHVRSLDIRRPCLSPQRCHSRGRFSPYAAATGPPLHRSKRTMGPQGSVAVVQDQPLRFMELMQRVATVMWDDARLGQRQQPQYRQTQNILGPTHAFGMPALPPSPTLTTTGESETLAIESMHRLYSLGNNIMTAATAAELGQSFNVDELADIFGVAAGFCRMLGYVDGAERCEEVGRRHSSNCNSGGSRW